MNPPRPQFIIIHPTQKSLRVPRRAHKQNLGRHLRAQKLRLLPTPGLLPLREVVHVPRPLDARRRLAMAAVDILVVVRAAYAVEAAARERVARREVLAVGRCGGKEKRVDGGAVRRRLELGLGRLGACPHRGGEVGGELGCEDCGAGGRDEVFGDDGLHEGFAEA